MELQIFNHPQFGEIRTVQDEQGLPWFVGKDVARVLGYSRATDAIRHHVDNEDKGVFKTKTPGGTQTVVYINESGLYSLILASKLPTAHDFKHWITSDVLPKIRQTGAYMTHDTMMQLLLQPESILQLCRTLVEVDHQREVAVNRCNQLTQMVGVLEPKAKYYDQLTAAGCYTVHEIAKDLGMTAAALNRLLQKLGVQYRQGRSWRLYAPFQDCGLTDIRTYLDSKGSANTKRKKCAFSLMVWTEKGRQFINKLVKEEGTLPLA